MVEPKTAAELTVYLISEQCRNCNPRLVFDSAEGCCVQHSSSGAGGGCTLPAAQGLAMLSGVCLQHSPHLGCTCVPGAQKYMFMLHTCLYPALCKNYLESFILYKCTVKFISVPFHFKWHTSLNSNQQRILKQSNSIPSNDLW